MLPEKCISFILIIFALSPLAHFVEGLISVKGNLAVEIRPPKPSKSKHGGHCCNKLKYLNSLKQKISGHGTLAGRFGKSKFNAYVNQNPKKQYGGGGGGHHHQYGEHSPSTQSQNYQHHEEFNQRPIRGHNYEHHQSPQEVGYQGAEGPQKDVEIIGNNPYEIHVYDTKDSPYNQQGYESHHQEPPSFAPHPGPKYKPKRPNSPKQRPDEFTGHSQYYGRKHPHEQHHEDEHFHPQKEEGSFFPSKPFESNPNPKSPNRGRRPPPPPTRYGGGGFDTSSVQHGHEYNQVHDHYDGGSEYHHEPNDYSSAGSKYPEYRLPPLKKSPNNNHLKLPRFAPIPKNKLPQLRRVSSKVESNQWLPVQGPKLQDVLSGKMAQLDHKVYEYGDNEIIILEDKPLMSPNEELVKASIYSKIDGRLLRNIMFDVKNKVPTTVMTPTVDMHPPAQDRAGKGGVVIEIGVESSQAPVVVKPDNVGEVTKDGNNGVQSN